MPQPPNIDSQLNDAQLSWEHGTGPARLSAQISAGIDANSNKHINVEYEFYRDQGGTKIRAALHGTRVSLQAPVGLAPATIAKPWGEELWYTGMETRGESQVELPGTGGGATLPLSSYLALAPERLCRRQPMVLLKILAPRADPVLGDLYLEAHAHKQEVYVVTQVDRSAWPDGKGAIRMGINQQLRRQFDSDQAFRSAYLDAVRAYEKVRRAIDDGILDPADSAPAESSARKEMNRFTSLLPLRVGDVVNVPPWLPHSLQHGVRVIEYQSPTYERLVIAFAQRVVTQSEWDSAAAIEHLNLEPPAQAPVESITPEIQRIASFSDFSTWRIHLEPGATLELPLDLPYAVCMTAYGSVTVNGMQREAEQACLVPHGALPVKLVNPTNAPAMCLAASAPS